MAETAEAENKACEAIARGMAAMFREHGAPDVAAKMCDEIATRIEARRVFSRLNKHRQVTP